MLGCTLSQEAVTAKNVSRVMVDKQQAGFQNV